MNYVRLKKVSPGAVVKIKVAGVKRDFLVVNQGNPLGGLYGNSCNGTWVLARDIYGVRQWNSTESNEFYGGSLFNYLNSEFLNLIDNRISAHINLAELPDVTCRVFLPNNLELGLGYVQGQTLGGRKLDYFEGGSGDLTPSPLRIARYNGRAAGWWLRTKSFTDYDDEGFPETDTRRAVAITETGGHDFVNVNEALGVRPMFILDGDMWVNETINMSVTPKAAPPRPGNISVGECKGGLATQLTWDAVEDPDGDEVLYRLEYSIDGGDYTYPENITLPFKIVPIGREWNTIQFRVAALDKYNNFSEYIETDVIQVLHNEPPVIEGIEGDLGCKTEGFALPYTVTDPNGDGMVVTERVGGEIHREYVPAGTDNQLDLTGGAFAALMAGTVGIEITAKDSFGNETSKTCRFTKAVRYFTLTLSEPLPSVSPVKKLRLNIERNIPAGGTFKAEAANNPYDSEPVWEDCTHAVRQGTDYIFQNSVNTAIRYGVNIRITASTGSAQNKCWVSGIEGAFE